MTDLFIELVFLACMMVQTVSMFIPWLCCANKANIKFWHNIIILIAAVGVCESSGQLYITYGNLEFLVISIMSAINVILILNILVLSWYHP